MSEQNNNNIDNESENSKKNNKKKKKYIFIGSIVAAVVIICFLCYLSFFKTTTETNDISTVIKNIEVVSVLNTLQVPYNSIVKIEKDNKKKTESTENGSNLDNIKDGDVNKNDEIDKNEYNYVTAYKGTVDFGIDFNNIKPEINVTDKSITLIIPKITIKDTFIDPNSVDTIYLGSKKADTDLSFIDRRRECEDDLKNKAKNDQKVILLARESTEQTIRNLLEPFVKKLHPGFQLKFEFE